MHYVCPHTKFIPYLQGIENAVLCYELQQSLVVFIKACAATLPEVRLVAEVGMFRCYFTFWLTLALVC